MAFYGEIGWIGKACPDHPAVTLTTRIMRSAAGYFVATQCRECRKFDPSPHSRETHYYASPEAIHKAFDNGTLKWRDTEFHPGQLTIEEL